MMVLTTEGDANYSILYPTRALFFICTKISKKKLQKRKIKLTKQFIYEFFFQIPNVEIENVAAYQSMLSYIYNNVYT